MTLVNWMDSWIHGSRLVILNKGSKIFPSTRSNQVWNSGLVVSSLSFCLSRGRDRVEIATSDDSDDGVGFRVDDDEVSK